MAILEVIDGRARPVLHRAAVATDGPRLEATAVCGVRGYVYARAGLVELGVQTECPDCAAEPRKTPRPAQADRLSAVLASEVARLRKDNRALRKECARLRRSRDTWMREAKSWRWAAAQQTPRRRRTS